MDSSIVIDGEGVVKVARRGQDVPSDAQVIDARGKFVIPGLIDAHVHWQGWMGEAFLLNGVTTILEAAAGFPLEWILTQKEGLARGKIVGPRMFSFGRSLRTSVSAREGEPTYPRIDSPEGAMKTAEELVGMGVDGLKIFTDFTPELISAVTQVARSHDLPTMGHINTSAREASDAGLEALAHTTGVLEAIIRPEDRAHAASISVPTIDCLDPNWFMRFQYADERLVEKLINRLVRNGTCIEPDLIHSGGMAVGPDIDTWLLEDFRFCEDPRVRYIPEAFKAECLGLRRIYRWDSLTGQDREKAHAGVYAVRRIVKLFHDAGGKILVGSGLSHVLPGLSYHRELQLLVGLGMTPMEVLVSATRGNAEYLRASNEIGTLEVGKLADIVILDADPLVDISNTKRISHVIQRGKLIELKYHPWHRNPIPDPRPTYIFGHFRPAITRIRPTIVRQRDETTLVVDGSGFVPEALVRMGQRDLATRFINESRLEAHIDADSTDSVGTYHVFVHKPQPTEVGGMSDPVDFIVTFAQ